MANAQRALLGGVIGTYLAATPAAGTRAEGTVQSTKGHPRSGGVAFPSSSGGGRRLRQVCGICSCSSSEGGGGGDVAGRISRFHRTLESFSINDVVDCSGEKDGGFDGESNNILAACVGAITLFAATSGALLVHGSVGTRRAEAVQAQQASITAPIASISSLRFGCILKHRREECQVGRGKDVLVLGSVQDDLRRAPFASVSLSHSVNREDGGRAGKSGGEAFGTRENKLGALQFVVEGRTCEVGNDDQAHVGNEAVDERYAGEVTGRRELHASVRDASEEAAVVANVETMAGAGSGHQHQQEEEDQVDEEEERLLREWQSKPIPLTVPLRIVSLRGSVPPVWLQEFGQCQSKRARYSVESRPDLHGIMTELRTALKEKKLGPKSAMAADLVTIGDSFLPLAIREGLIDPIPSAEQSPWYQRLGPLWQDMCCCSCPAAGQDIQTNQQEGDSKRVWAAPYRWGYTAIAYRIDKFGPACSGESKEGKGRFLEFSAWKRPSPPGGCVPLDWSDLWRPELKGRIAMVNAPREVIGIVLKSLGASYNTRDWEKDVEGGRAAVVKKYVSLRKQVRLFDNQYYLKALAAGDVWVAVGWSSDLIPLAQRSSDWGVIVPLSGTSFWADLWVVPSAPKIPSDKVGGRIRGPSPLISQWMDFCLQPQRALALKLDLASASPLLLPQKPMRARVSPQNSLVASQTGEFGGQVLIHTEPAIGVEEPGTASQNAEHVWQEQHCCGDSSATAVSQQAEVERSQRENSVTPPGIANGRKDFADGFADALVCEGEKQKLMVESSSLADHSQTDRWNANADKSSVAFQQQKGQKDRLLKPTVPGALLGSNSRVRFPTNLVDGMVPTDIASRSEFLQPLSERQVENFRWLLEQNSAEEKDSSLWAIHGLTRLGHWALRQMPFKKSLQGWLS